MTLSIAKTVLKYENVTDDFNYADKSCIAEESVVSVKNFAIY